MTCTSKSKIVLFKPLSLTPNHKVEKKEPILEKVKEIVKQKKKSKKIKNCGLTMNTQPNNSNSKTKLLRKGNSMLQLANMLKTTSRKEINNQLKTL